MAQDEEANPKSQSHRTPSARSNRADAAGATDRGTGRTAAKQNVYVFEKNKKKSRKRRYTLGTRVLQRFALGASGASKRIADAVADGMESFYEESRKSSRKRKDGLIRDAILNATRGFRDSSRQLGKAPYVFARQMRGDSRRFFRTVFGYYD
jgi:hypothetical protein